MSDVVPVLVDVGWTGEIVSVDRRIERIIKRRAREWIAGQEGKRSRVPDVQAAAREQGRCELAAERNVYDIRGHLGATHKLGLGDPDVRRTSERTTATACRSGGPRNSVADPRHHDGMGEINPITDHRRAQRALSGPGHCGTMDANPAGKIRQREEKHPMGVGARSAARG